LPVEYPDLGTLRSTSENRSYKHNNSSLNTASAAQKETNNQEVYVRKIIYLLHIMHLVKWIKIPRIKKLTQNNFICLILCKSNNINSLKYIKYTNI